MTDLFKGYGHFRPLYGLYNRAKVPALWANELEPPTVNLHDREMTLWSDDFEDGDQVDMMIRGTESYVNFISTADATSGKAQAIITDPNFNGLVYPLGVSRPYSYGVGVRKDGVTKLKGYRTKAATRHIQTAPHAGFIPTPVTTHSWTAENPGLTYGVSLEVPVGESGMIEWGDGSFSDFANTGNGVFLYHSYYTGGIFTINCTHDEVEG